jgi:hypothetical protein
MHLACKLVSLMPSQRPVGETKFVSSAALFELCIPNFLSEVTVTNNLKFNGTSVHWHGIRQHLSIAMDGVPGECEAFRSIYISTNAIYLQGVTQCPTAVGYLPFLLYEPD